MGDFAELRRAAEAIAAEVGKVPGVVDARVLAPADVPLIDVRPRALDVASAGLDVADVLGSVQALRFGIDAGVIYDGPLAIPVVLTLAGAATEWELAHQSVPSPSGGTVALGAIADVVRAPTPGVVQHDEGMRRLSVGFNVRGADLGGAVEAAQARVAKAVPLRDGYIVRWGGQYESLEAAKARLRIVIPLVIGLIVLVLLFTFRHPRHTFVILTHVPFACVGGVVALAVRGMPMSISAAIGFIALSGIAVMNGVVLLSQVRTLEDGGMPPATAILTAARARARPVLMTALVAALGFVPMMLATGVGAEVQRPLATVVVGGLLTSTMLTLIVLPSVYPWLVGRRRKDPA